jgi:acetoin:2,6-dichlorophenolindophenol oxidoreductase subunit beta
MSITYLEAIREAQAKALRDDPRVFIYGQDVGAFGGAFKATKNLAKEFPGRVLDSPISEDAMVGSGRRRGDRRHAADHRNAVRGFFHRRLQPDRQPGRDAFLAHECPCPITVRLPFGGTSGSGPFHSQCMEAIYAHYPGLVVLTPATVEDAYSMLLEAVAIDDPVIFCEHKFLYYHLKAEKLPTRRCPSARRASRAKAAT